MSSLVKFIYYVSVLFFLANLFYAYYQFPETVAIGYSANVGLKVFKTKAELFYMGAIAFLIFNLLVLIIKKAIPFMPFQVIAFPNKSFWLASPDSKEALVKVFIVWFDSFAIVFNLFLGTIFLLLYVINIIGIKDFPFFAPLIYGFLWALAGWWLVLVGRLMYRVHEL